MRTPLLLSLCFVLSAVAARADLAFFSEDGKSVTFVPKTEESCLLQLEVATGKVTKIVLSGTAAKGTVTSVCRGGDGETLLTTEGGVFVHDAKGTRKLADAPVKGAWAIGDLATAPAAMPGVGDWLFLSGNDVKDENQRVFYARKPGAKAFAPVFCRRVKQSAAAAFTADGRLFFGGDGDLWEGAFEPMEEGDAAALVLKGARIAPLGVFNTDETNSGSMWAEQVMVAGKSLYVRLKGHLISEIVRVPMPAAPALDEKSGAMSSTAASYRIQSEMLSKVQVIANTQDDVRVCAATAADGQERLFYRVTDDGGLGLYLWDAKSGKAKKVGVEKSEE